MNLFLCSAGLLSGERKRVISRIKIVLLLGCVAVAAAFAFRESRLPRPVPVADQRSGEAILRGQLDRIAKTPFGSSARGRALAGIIERHLKNATLIFATGLDGSRGLSWRGLFREERLYVMALEMNESRILHQTPHQMIEAVFHEAVHLSKSRFHFNSIEEECDAFLAGITVERMSLGELIPEPVRIDRSTVAEFVLKSYPELRRNPRYEPIGFSLDVLKRKTGLE